MRYLFIYLFIYFPIIVFSQSMDLDWSICLGSQESNYPEGIAVLPNGNIVSAITVYNNDPAFNNYHGYSDIWVIILDENGSIVNNKCFGGSDYEGVVDIEVGNDFMYIIGYTASTDGDAISEPVGNPMADLWIIKANFDLNIIWEKRYGPLGPCWLCSSDLTNDGGLVVITDFFDQAGGTVSQYYGGTDIWTFEVDTNGELLWEKTLGNQFENTAGNILSTDHGTTMVLGETNFAGDMVDCVCHSSDGITRDIWLVELNNQGEIIWQECYGGSNWELGLDIQQDGNGYTMFTHSRSNDFDVSGNHGNGETSDYWFAHINGDGIIEWQSCYGGSDDEGARQFYKTSENGYILIGWTGSNDGDVSFNNGFNDVWVVELDSNRNIIVDYSYGGLNNNYPTRNSIAQRGEKDFIIAALARDYYDIGTGDIQCTPYPINEEQSSWTFRIHDPTVGSNTKEGNYKSLKVYPNPSSDHVYIELPQHHQQLEILILDVFGQEIQKLNVLPQHTLVLWEVNHVLGGVYFYQTEIDGINYSGKILIQ